METVRYLVPVREKKGKAGYIYGAGRYREHNAQRVIA